MLTHFSLFSGIGGIDLAAEWAGFETVGQCEIDDFATKVLEKHWHNVPRWRDVRDVTVKSVREKGIKEITLLSGGFPCQPHSLAGKRKASADERDLWGEFARIICEVRPKWVLGENVPGLLSSEDGRFFGRVLNDLAKVATMSGGVCMELSGLEPLKRDRVFIIAYANSNRLQRREKPEGISKSRENTQKQPERLHQALLCNTNGQPKFQTNSAIKPSRSKRNTRENVTREHRRKTSGAYWEISEPPVLGVDDGVPDRVDRSKCLGNAVVPQQVYPILQAMADIENAEENP